MQITYTERPAANFIGVWVDKKPAGRIRIHEGQYRAFTNKRAPGKAHLGTFTTQEQAAAAVAEAHKTLR
jgi:hypothetical protein